MRTTYLDNNATTQPAPEVVAAVQESNEHLWANPSSVHRFGQMVRHSVELARAKLAALINCRDRELIFTSGGTESNNLALRGVLEQAFTLNTTNKQPPRGVLITTKTEHSAIRQPAERLAELGVKVVYLPVDSYGQVNPNQFQAVLAENAHDQSIVLVSILWANNETGLIQPIDELTAICQAYRQQQPHSKVLFHTDATQAVGKVPVDLAKTAVDLLTLSAHKFHGPKGIGALYVRTGVRLRSQHDGGPQERERRGGTENTAGIVAMGVAAELARQFLADREQIDRLTAMRNRLESGILEHLPNTVVNSQAPPQSRSDAKPVPSRLWNTSNMGFARLEAEAILLGLSERGVCASAGAACSSGSLDPSPVLLAMGVPEVIAHGSIRFSISRFTTDHDIDIAIQMVNEVIQKLMKTMPVPT